MTGLGGGKHLVAKPAKRQTLLVRWESALPIRSAELKVGDPGAPAWNGEYYAIAVYQVPSLKDQKTLPVESRKTAFLRHDGQKELKAARVDLLFDEKLTTVVYLFPRSAEITKENSHIWFAEQIGQSFVEQVFDPAEMQYQGKLEL